METKRSDRLNIAFTYLKNKGMLKTQQELADRMESNKSSVSAAMNGNETYLTDNFLVRFNGAFNGMFSLVWLMTGEGEMLAGAQSSVSGTRVPQIPLSSVGGTLRDIACDGVELNSCEMVMSPVSNAEFAISVYGDSMSPTYPSGSRVFIRKINHESFIPWGNVFVLDTVNGIYIKEVQRGNDENHIMCVSHNPSGRFPAFEISLNDIYGMYRVLASVTVTL